MQQRAKYNLCPKSSSDALNEANYEKAAFADMTNFGVAKKLF